MTLTSTDFSARRFTTTHEWGFQLLHFLQQLVCALDSKSCGNSSCCKKCNNWQPPWPPRTEKRVRLVRHNEASPQTDKACNSSPRRKLGSSVPRRSPGFRRPPE